MLEPHERLKAARIAAGFETAPAAADAMGISHSTYMGHENGSRGFRAKAVRYARMFKTTPEWLLFGRGDADTPLADHTPLDARMIPLLGEVRAGAWLEISDHEEPEEWIPFADRDYQRAQVFALNVVGRSMDRDYPDGTTIIVVNAKEAGVREGDHVVVRRRHGSTTETTLKELAVNGDQILLWPRSSDPNHQEPILVSHDRDSDDGVEIIGVVIATYRKRGPRGGRMINLS